MKNKEMCVGLHPYGLLSIPGLEACCLILLQPSTQDVCAWRKPAAQVEVPAVSDQQHAVRAVEAAAETLQGPLRLL